jgi:hypothetical protein
MLLDDAISLLAAGQQKGRGPLGMAETSPRALAPIVIASAASSRLAIQQTFT